LKWSGIEAHFAVIIASLPALNHFFRKLFRDTNLSDRFKPSSLGRRYGSHYGSGYNKTSHRTTDNMSTSDKAVIRVTQEVHLQEYSRDYGYSPKMPSGARFDTVKAQKGRAWLDESTSDDDSIRRHTTK
jgi:hypothetical protein